ncbi:MAG: M90 family metallopeptidase [Thiotrichaceae bacterium]
MFKWLTKLRRQYILKQHPLSNTLWLDISKKLPLLRNLDRKELKQLRKWATLFIHSKTFTGVQGLQVTDEIRLIIAIQACLPILNLDLEYYDGWVEIVIYPNNFIVKRDVHDHNGLVHNEERVLSGESWSRGPVILSWNEVQADSFYPTAGHNVVIHEFSHKLDMLNGRANGMPPLHPTMHREQWTDSLSNAYTELKNDLEDAYINRYASTNPAEFFAVISEYFFTAPETLKLHQAKVYEQLVLFYKQNPLR